MDIRLEAHQGYELDALLAAYQIKIEQETGMRLSISQIEDAVMRRFLEDKVNANPWTDDGYSMTGQAAVVKRYGWETADTLARLAGKEIKRVASSQAA